MAATVESGTFRLHKFEQAIGEEKYEITPDGDAITIASTFHFRDRGTPVDLSSTLHLKPDYTPVRLEIKGKTSRFSTIDTTLNAAGVNGPTFPIATYAPVSVQMALVRYWAQHGRPASITRTTGGSLTIEPRGSDTVTIKGQSLAADRYTVRGLIWGRETLWFDSAMRLVAAVTVDDEMDHFEAIREDWEDGLAFFVRRAAEDNMQALADLSGSIARKQTGVLAITGATLIDGTDHLPLPDAVVLVDSGRILAVGSRRRIKIPRTPRGSMRPASSCCPAFGTRTRTSNKWNGDRFIWPPASPRCAIAAMNSISSRPRDRLSIPAEALDRNCCSAGSSTATARCRLASFALPMLNTAGRW
jgi:hypothetical protein